MHATSNLKYNRAAITTSPTIRLGYSRRPASNGRADRGVHSVNYLQTKKFIAIKKNILGSAPRKLGAEVYKLKRGGMGTTCTRAS